MRQALKHVRKIKKVGDFEKVSFERFSEDMLKILNQYAGYTDLEKKELITASYNDIKIPTRATSGSAGHDFFSTLSFGLSPDESVTIPTGIKVFVDEGWWLGILPRSSLGFKYRIQLDNTIGVIDSDYYYADNEGHIFIKMTNCSQDKEVYINKGDAVAQGIFIPYGITYYDDVQTVRTGGIGSTNS